MIRIFLTRKVKGRVRYYKMTLLKTLFDEYLVERTYGALINKKPTGMKCDVFSSYDIAKQCFENIYHSKELRGYRLIK